MPPVDLFQMFVSTSDRSFLLFSVISVVKLFSHCFVFARSWLLIQAMRSSLCMFLRPLWIIAGALWIIAGALWVITGVLRITLCPGWWASTGSWLWCWESPWSKYCRDPEHTELNPVSFNILRDSAPGWPLRLPSSIVFYVMWLRHPTAVSRHSGHAHVCCHLLRNIPVAYLFIR